MPGDEVRHVNWRALLRRRTLYITRYQQERNADIVLMLDTLSQVGASPTTSLDAGVRAAASLASAFLGRSRRDRRLGRRDPSRSPHQCRRGAAVMAVRVPEGRFRAAARPSWSASPRSRTRRGFRRWPPRHSDGSRIQNDLIEQVAESRQQLEAEIRSRLAEALEAAERALGRARERHTEGQAAVRSEIERLEALQREAEELARAR